MRVFVAGHRGLVGSAVWRHLQSEGFTNLLGRISNELDLRDNDSTLAFFAKAEPQVVVLAAAKVGGIMANSTHPVDFLSDNLRIQLNILDAARQHGVQRLLFLGSSCIYPKFAPQPISEDSLLTGPLEPTNDTYAIAKIAGVLHVQAIRRQYGLHYTLGHAHQPVWTWGQLRRPSVLTRPACTGTSLRRGPYRNARTVTVPNPRVGDELISVPCG